jgi:nicotinic acid mononucleotide adenylyltransferase
MNRNTASYALLTVEDVRRKYGQEAKLSLIVSAEYLNPEHQWHLPKWMGAEELFKQCDFLVFPTYDIDYQQASTWAKQIPQAKIEIANYPSLPISSEMIRQRVSSGQSIRYLTPYAVQVMINSKGLYKKPSALAKTTRKC